MSAGEGLRGDRPLEVLAVLLLGIATLGSGWCGYQSARWNGEEARWARASSNEHVEAARLFGQATQQVSYDSMVVGQFAQAVVLGDTELQDFYRRTLIRAEFEPVLRRWREQVEAGDTTPANLLEDQLYLDEQFAEYRAAQQRASDAEVASAEAGDTGTRYVLLTLMLALALFFAGVTTSFRLRFARLFLLAGAIVTVGYAAARLAALPTM